MTDDAMTQRRRTVARRRSKSGAALMVPGAANALAARVIEALGFEAVYLSGAGVTNTFLGMPDLGFVASPTSPQHTAAHPRRGRRCRSSSTPTPASATRSTCATRCARWSAPAPTRSSSKTRSCRSAAATSRART